MEYHRLTVHRQDLFGQVRELEGLYEYFVLSCDIVPPERDPLHIESKGIYKIFAVTSSICSRSFYIL